MEDAPRLVFGLQAAVAERRQGRFQIGDVDDGGYFRTTGRPGAWKRPLDSRGAGLLLAERLGRDLEGGAAHALGVDHDGVARLADEPAALGEDPELGRRHRQAADRDT